MLSLTPSRHSTSAPSDGSRTLTTQDVQPLSTSSDGESAVPRLQGTLRLRGGPRNGPRVAWDERVIDNENCGRKKSKICCIYHKPKPFDQSSDESSDDDSDSDSGDDDRARPPRRHRGHDHDHHPDRSNALHRDLAGGGDGDVVHELEDADEPNAYESIPNKEKARKRATTEGN